MKCPVLRALGFQQCGRGNEDMIGALAQGCVCRCRRLAVDARMCRIIIDAVVHDEFFTQMSGKKPGVGDDEP